VLQNAKKAVITKRPRDRNSKYEVCQCIFSDGRVETVDDGIPRGSVPPLLLAARARKTTGAKSRSSKRQAKSSKPSRIKLREFINSSSSEEGSNVSGPISVNSSPAPAPASSPAPPPPSLYAIENHQVGLKSHRNPENAGTAVTQQVVLCQSSSNWMSKGNRKTNRRLPLQVGVFLYC
jgi:hypothetical protein